MRQVIVLSVVGEWLFLVPCGWFGAHTFSDCVLGRPFDSIDLMIFDWSENYYGKFVTDQPFCDPIGNASWKQLNYNRINRRCLTMA